MVFRVALPSYRAKQGTTCISVIRSNKQVMVAAIDAVNVVKFGFTQYQASQHSMCCHTRFCLGILLSRVFVLMWWISA